MDKALRLHSYLLRELHASDRSIIHLLPALPPAPRLPLSCQASPRLSKHKKEEERGWGERDCILSWGAHGLAVQVEWQPQEGGLLGEFPELLLHSRNSWSGAAGRPSSLEPRGEEGAGRADKRTCDDSFCTSLWYIRQSWTVGLLLGLTKITVPTHPGPPHNVPK